MRVILDTNILVAALISPSGPPAAILQAFLDERFTLVTCEPPLDELRRVTRDPKLRAMISCSRSPKPRAPITWSPATSPGCSICANTGGPGS